MAQHPKPFEILESVEINFPGLYHEAFTLKLQEANHLQLGVILRLEDSVDFEQFVIVQQVLSATEVSLKYLTADRNLYVKPEHLAAGKRLRPMFFLLPYSMYDGVPAEMLFQVD